MHSHLQSFDASLITFFYTAITVDFSPTGDATATGGTAALPVVGVGAGGVSSQQLDIALTVMVGALAAEQVLGLVLEVRIGVKLGPRFSSDAELCSHPRHALTLDFAGALAWARLARACACGAGSGSHGGHILMLCHGPLVRLWPHHPVRDLTGNALDCLVTLRQVHSLFSQPRWGLVYIVLPALDPRPSFTVYDNVVASAARPLLLARSPPPAPALGSLTLRPELNVLRWALPPVGSLQPLCEMIASVSAAIRMLQIYHGLQTAAIGLLTLRLVGSFAFQGKLGVVARALKSSFSGLSHLAVVFIAVTFPLAFLLTLLDGQQLPPNGPGNLSTLPNSVVSVLLQYITPGVIATYRRAPSRLRLSLLIGRLPSPPRPASQHGALSGRARNRAWWLPHQWRVPRKRCLGEGGLHGSGYRVSSCRQGELPSPNLWLFFGLFMFAGSTHTHLRLRCPFCWHS